MRKANQRVVTVLTFKEYLEKFEPTVLQGAVIQLDGSIGWGLLKAFLKQRQREFEIASLDLAGHSGKSNESAKASGYAQACEDVSDQFMQDLLNSVNGINGFVEGPARAEEI